MNLAEADSKANELLAAIKPFCVPDRAIIAGSVRRRVRQPTDIELVALPYTNDFEKLDGLRKLINGGRFGRVDVGAFPSRYTRLKDSRCQYDIFFQSRESYGLNLWIRTGPVDYVARGLAFWKRITNGGYSEGAILHLADGTQVPTWTEQAVYDAFTKYSGKLVKFLDPERRK